MAAMQTNLILPGTIVLFLALKGYSFKELNNKSKDYSLLDDTCLVWKQMGMCLPAVNQCNTEKQISEILERLEHKQ